MPDERAEGTGWINVVWACLVTHVVTLLSCLVMIVFCVHLMHDSGSDERQYIIEKLEQLSKQRELGSIRNENSIELHERPDNSETISELARRWRDRQAENDK